MAEFKDSFGRNFEALLRLLRGGRPRDKRPERAEQVLALPLAADVRSLVEAWAAHEPPHVSIGEFWLNDTAVGDSVPPVGDIELEQPARKDVVMLGTSPGGDLFGAKRDTRGTFRAIIRVLHDAAWTERAEARSLEAFIDLQIKAARKVGRETSLDRVLGEMAREAKTGRTPAKPPAPGKLGLVPAVVPSVTANESQAVSAELAAVAAAHPRAQVAWLAGGTIALLKPAFLETLQPTPELEALKKGVFGLPAMGGNLYHSRAELVLLADEDRQPIARYALAADRMQSLAGGRLLALASVARGKGAGATRILAWKDGALHEVATFKQDAGIISEIAGRTFGAAGLEFLGLNEALTKKTRTALQPVAFPEARLTPAPDAPRYVPSEPTRALVGSGGYLSDLRAGGFIFAALWDGRVYRAAIIDETGAAPILRLSEPPVTGTALYYGFSKSASRWIVLPRDGELAFLDPQTGAAQMGPWVVRRTLAETVAMLGDLVALVEQAPGVSGVPFGTLKVLEDGRDVAALDLGIATSLTSLEGLDFVLAAPPRPVLGDGESFLIRLRDERPLRAALEVSAVIPFAVKAAWTADGKLFVTDPADITYESALPPL